MRTFRRVEGSRAVRYIRFAPRERQVLQGVRAGQRVKEIAAVIGISPATIYSHLRRIYTELGICSMAQAALWAERHPEAFTGDGWAQLDSVVEDELEPAA